MKILCVDDEDDIREIAKMSLELDPDIEVATAASGLIALETARSWHPDLIVLDYMMPDMDGPETFARLRADPATNATPIIFMTARAQAVEVAALIELGAATVIPKPFDPLTLASTVRDYL
ncbi:Response regulator receiver domain-containing protein [Fulvimarina manganoxydans]|uniref:Response regulator receiver domain-containing protein n=1 Tax=Fulvimarina manganoxydans TaxID=937218 RepID=A0A1W2EQW8_9HYPH|nr:response regulator [Fulvimarina manganoxydans]SMD12127.1 Response regulator receiver domain-containing protein [Fulvimarina manganoxydans]